MYRPSTHIYFSQLFLNTDWHGGGGLVGLAIFLSLQSHRTSHEEGPHPWLKCSAISILKIQIF